MQLKSGVALSISLLNEAVNATPSKLIANRGNPSLVQNELGKIIDQSQGCLISKAESTSQAIRWPGSLWKKYCPSFQCIVCQMLHMSLAPISNLLVISKHTLCDV